MTTTEFDSVWRWRKDAHGVPRLPERFGHRCRVLCRGTKNSVLVEFEDGFRAVASRYAVRPRPA